MPNKNFVIHKKFQKKAKRGAILAEKWASPFWIYHPLHTGVLRLLGRKQDEHIGIYLYILS
jgi:hypothetical protein